MFVETTIEIHTRILRYIAFNKPDGIKRVNNRSEYGSTYESIEFVATEEDAQNFFMMFSDCRTPFKTKYISASKDNLEDVPFTTIYIQEGDRVVLEPDGCLRIYFSSNPDRLTVSELIGKNMISVYPKATWYDQLNEGVHLFGGFTLLSLVTVLISYMSSLFD